MDLLFMLAQAMFYSLAVYFLLVLLPIILVHRSLSKKCRCDRCPYRADGSQHS